MSEEQRTRSWLTQVQGMALTLRAWRTRPSAEQPLSSSEFHSGFSLLAPKLGTVLLHFNASSETKFVLGAGDEAWWLSNFFAYEKSWVPAP